MYPALAGRFFTTQPSGKIDVDNVDTLLDLLLLLLLFCILLSLPQELYIELNYF